MSTEIVTPVEPRVHTPKRVTDKGYFEKLVESWGQFVFRRANNPYIADDGNVIKGYIVYKSDDVFRFVEPGMLSDEERDAKFFNSHVDTLASRFNGLTSQFSLRENDPYNKTPIFYHTNNRYEFNFANLVISDVKTPAPYVVVRSNDLLCGTVKKDKEGRLFYDKWFVCSEQFFRLVTVCLFGEQHQSLINLCEETRNEADVLEMETVRRTLMRGNRLAIGSAIYKERQARIDSGLEPMTPEDEAKRYVRTRTEACTRLADHVHWYNLIAMLYVYGEYPDEHNVPNNIKGPRVKNWILPPYTPSFIDFYFPQK